MNQTIDQIDVGNVLGNPHNVVLYNDNSHGMEEVANQIIKATGCSTQKAFDIMLEAHNKGRSIVLTSHRERCEHAAFILEAIRLSVKIEQC